MLKSESESSSDRKAVAHVLDYASLHGKDLTDTRGEVRTLKLLRNVTSVHQLMTGVINARKKLYRERILRGVVLNIENRAERGRLKKHIRADMCGIREGHEPHILDVAKIVKPALDDFTQTTFVRS